MKKLNIIFTAVILCVLLSFPVLTFISEKQGYSVFENRTLEPMPTLSVSAVLDGSFFANSETYLKDHVAGRDTLLTGYTAVQKYLLCKPNVNEVIDADTSLLPYIAPTHTPHASEADITAEAEQLAVISEKTDFLYLGVPSQATMFADEYPSYLRSIPDYNKNTADLFTAALEERGISFADGAKLLTKDNYFSTDHHFDISGGYALYEAICDFADVDAVAWDNFEVKEYDTEIYGSRNRKIYKLSDLSDRISYYVENLGIEFERYDNGEQVQSTVFTLPSDGEVPSYGIYMGGDVAETVIKTNREELPDILIYGDSYTNAVECFAYLSFDETRYLDLRYYDEMSLEKYIETYQPDCVVCIRDDGKYADLTGNGELLD